MREAWVFVSIEGKVAFDIAFGDAYSMRDGVANVRVEDKQLWAVVDREGKYVVAPRYGKIWPSYHRRMGFQASTDSYHWGYFDVSGEVAITPAFDEIKNFLPALPLALVRIGQRWGVIRVDGTALVPVEMTGVSIGDDGTVCACRDGKWGYFDESGKPMIDFRFDAASAFREGLAIVTIGGKRGFVDRKGAVVVEAKYEEAYDFCDGLAIVKSGGKYGFVDPKGALVIPCEFTNVAAFGNGRGFVWPAPNVVRCIDKTGKRVGDLEFASAITFDHGTAVVGDGKHLGLIDTEGNVVLPMEQDLIDPVTGGHRRIGKRAEAYDRLYGYVNDEGAIVCEPKWLAAAATEGDWIAVKTMTGVPMQDVAEPAAQPKNARAQAAARVLLQTKPPLVDAILAVAQDRAAVQKLLEGDGVKADIGKLAAFVHAALGDQSVTALEAIVERMWTVEYPHANWDCHDLLRSIDTFEADCACARVWGTITDPDEKSARALRALAIAASGKGVNPELAARSIAELEAKRPGSVAEALATKPAEAAALREIAARYGIGLVEAKDGELPEALRPTKSKKKLPEWWNAKLVARPLLAGRERALSVAALDELVAKFDKSDLDLEAVRAACDPLSLRDFAWSVFQAWMTARAPAKQKWGLELLGAFGDDVIVARLAPLVAEWPGQSAHARAVRGIAMLQRIGTDAALRAIYRLSQRAKFGGLKGEAQSSIRLIAQRRGLTEEELADRLVPDFELDDDGSLTLDFGDRSFRASFDEGLRPFVIDASGKRTDDLPKAKQSDDPAKALAAHETWKSLKKEVRAIASLQVERLEKAMCARRRWHEDTFRPYFVEHPLLQHLARRLVWGVYEGNVLGETFRIAEDKTYAGANDAAITVSAHASIGVVHPMELGGAEAIARWSRVLADYELLQPFEQLGRAVHQATPEEKASKKLARFEGREVRAGAVMGLLGHGWSRGPVEDNGIVYELVHPLGHMTVSPGIYFAGGAQQDDQKLSAIALGPSFDPIAFSELVRSLERLVA